MILASKACSASMLGARASWKTGIPPVIPIDSIEDQTVQVNVQIGRRAEALNEGDRAGVGFAPFQSGLLDQKCRE